MLLDVLVTSGKSYITDDEYFQRKTATELVPGEYDVVVTVGGILRGCVNDEGGVPSC